MSDPRICNCGCHSLSRMTASYAARLEREINYILSYIGEGVLVPDSQKRLAEKITILTYLKGLKNEPD